MSEDCHDCSEPCGDGGSGSGGRGGSGSGSGGGTPNPRHPDGSELPPWPAWLENPRVIGTDTFSGQAIAVGLFMNDARYTEDTAPYQNKALIGKRIPHSNDGLAMAATATRDDRWVTTHLANADEIAAYDCLVFIDLKLEWTDLLSRPPYNLDEIPPFPYWFVDGLIVLDCVEDNMRMRLAIGRNCRDGYLWVIKSLDSHEWFSYRYADGEDKRVYDRVFLSANKISPDVAS